MTKERAGVTIWRSIYPILIFLGVDTLISMVPMYAHMFREIFAWMAANPNAEITTELIEQFTESATNYLYSIALYITLIRSFILIPLFFVFMHLDTRRDKRLEKHVEYKPYKHLWLLILIPLGIVSCLGFNNFVSMMVDWMQSGIDALGIEYDLMSTFNDTSEVIYSGGIVLQLLVTCVCAPLVEETLFRGIVHKRLRGIMGATPAMIISSVLFGIIHGNIVQFIYATLIGLICAYVYEKFKTICAPILVHFSANIFSVFITFLTQANTDTTGDVPSIGYYMLLTVALLAVIFVLLFILEKKFNREPKNISNSEMENAQ